MDRRIAEGPVSSAADRRYIGISGRSYNERNINKIRVWRHQSAMMPLWRYTRVGDSEKTPKFLVCCNNAGLSAVLRQPPDLSGELEELLSGNNAICSQFRADIRAHNSACIGVHISRRSEQAPRRYLHIHQY